MTNTKRAAEIVRLMRIYMPSMFVQQLLGDLSRSKAADADPHLRAVFAEAYRYGQGVEYDSSPEPTS